MHLCVFLANVFAGASDNISCHQSILYCSPPDEDKEKDKDKETSSRFVVEAIALTVLLD